MIPPNDLHKLKPLRDIARRNKLIHKTANRHTAKKIHLTKKQRGNNGKYIGFGSMFKR